MFRALFVALVGLSFLAAGTVAQPPKGRDSQKKDGPKNPPKDKSPQKPAIKEIVGMFKTKDLDKKTVTITVDGKEKVFKVTSSTKVLGPRGGESDDGLKDDRIDKGYKLTILPEEKDSDIAAEIRLPFRNERQGAEKKK